MFEIGVSFKHCILCTPTCVKEKINIEGVLSGMVRICAPLCRKNHHLIRCALENSVTKSVTAHQSSFYPFKECILPQSVISENPISVHL